MLKARSISHQL